MGWAIVLHWNKCFRVLARFDPTPNGKPVGKSSGVQSIYLWRCEFAEDTPTWRKSPAFDRTQPDVGRCVHLCILGVDTYANHSLLSGGDKFDPSGKRKFSLGLHHGSTAAGFRVHEYRNRFCIFKRRSFMAILKAALLSIRHQRHSRSRTLILVLTRHGRFNPVHASRPQVPGKNLEPALK